MAMIRQTCIVRTDLGMGVGLMCAQVAHIHALPLFSVLSGDQIDCFSDWKDTPYIFNHGVPNLESLKYYLDAAKAACLPVFVWEDTIFTSFYPGHKTTLKTIIGFSIGPADSDAIKAVIGDLPLLS